MWLTRTVCRSAGIADTCARAGGSAAGAARAGEDAATDGVRGAAKRTAGDDSAWGRAHLRESRDFARPAPGRDPAWEGEDANGVPGEGEREGEVESLRARAWLSLARCWLLHLCVRVRMALISIGDGVYILRNELIGGGEKSE